MSWKSEMKLADLDAGQPLEIRCLSCGTTRTEIAAALLQTGELRHAWLDEVERELCCSLRYCRGKVRIALIHTGRTEGFVGGMA